MADYIDNEAQQQEESSGIDFRKLWSLVVLNWYWLVFSTLLCTAAAYVYIRYQTPVYNVASKILIKGDSKNGFRSSGVDMESFGLVNNNNGFENELEILSSTAIATRTVKELKLYVRYFIEGRVAVSEQYKTSPIIVDLEESRLNELDEVISMEMTKNDKGIHVAISSRTIAPSDAPMEVDIASFPAAINTKVGQLLLSQNPGQTFSGRKLTVEIYPPIMAGRKYAASMTVSPTSKMTDVAVLSLNDNLPERACDYLSQVVMSYNQDANEDKNEVARNTEQFINDRLEIIRAELDETEEQLENYKRSNELVNLPSDAGAAMTNSATYQQRQVEMQTQMALVRSLIDYVSNPSNCMELIPANIGITDQSTNKMISDYNTQVLTRNRLLRASSENSPQVRQLADDITVLWNGVRQQLNSIYANLQTQKQSIDNQYARFSGKVSNTPGQERVLNNIGRQQEIKAGLYLMLLQKREDNYITLNSVATKARVIDEPMMNGKVSPKTTIIMLASVIIGLFFPLGLMYLLEMLRFRIEGRADLEKLSKLTIMADIPLTTELADGKRAVVVKENSNNMMEEAFRSLRTNLRFVLEGDEKVICTTSCVPGEGKTFIATNLAMSLALLGKKVVIVGLDVRKPRLVKLFGLPSSTQGISTFLASDEENMDMLDKQIVHGVINANLDVLPAGTIPPNPGELITRQKLDDAFAYLRSKYDYVIVDTPPVGLVSDTYELARLVDVTFFVVRSEFSTKADVEIINRAAAEHKLPKINLVLNGMDLTKKKYGFYYGYGKYKYYSKYGTYYGRYGHYGTYGNYGDKTQHIEK
ncbi:MAG: polysaccharide biosynthesis tyrosine autokinase [Bacteroidaceae bacterium]|nr:polysaccharide biosynthesis tyrosine autokinase [Bacteroidaceae bacterium]